MKSLPLSLWHRKTQPKHIMKYTKELNDLMKASTIAKLNNYFDSVIDVSYHNDSTDSLLIDEKYLLFLPNADETDLDV